MAPRDGPMSLTAREKCCGHRQLTRQRCRDGALSQSDEREHSGGLAPDGRAPLAKCDQVAPRGDSTKLTRVKLLTVKFLAKQFQRCLKVMRWNAILLWTLTCLKASRRFIVSVR